MGRHFPSLLILRGKPRRRPRPQKPWDAWAEDMKMRQRVRRAEQVADRWEREEQMRRDSELIATSDRTQRILVQQGFRDLERRVEGIEQREVLGHDAETKLYQSNLVMEHNDEIAILRDEQREQRAEIEHLRERMGDLVRALGEDTDV